MLKNKVVVLGLSGGVDSAVSFYLLRKMNYKVIPIFMQNWDTVANNDIRGHNKKIPDGCESNLDYLSAKKIANFFHTKLIKINFVKEYWKYVFKNFLLQYQHSYAPNPDILCNKYIKFGFFKKYAFEKFKNSYIATGHYAQIKKTKNGYFLVAAKDKTKDQTYFLCNLGQQQIKNVIFPLGKMYKKDVRKLAKKIKLPVWNRKDSTGICFIGKRNFFDFLQNYLPSKPGKIIDITSKEILGDHIGTMYYTIGQNKNLHLAGQKHKYYVCKKDVNNNYLYVCQQKLKNKYLLSNKCLLKNFNFINDYSIMHKSKFLKVRFRHLQKLNKVLSFTRTKKNNFWKLEYTNTLAVTPGQYAVIYDRNICIGGGVIEKVYEN